MTPLLQEQLKSEYVASIGNDGVRVDTIISLVEQTNDLAPGDYIEIGVLWGTSLKLIHRAMDPARTLYAFDTFEGFDPRDVALEFKRTNNPDYSFHPTSVERVREHLGDPANLRIVKGWFPGTFVDYQNVDWRFAHIDVDLGAPTASALKAIWPKLVPGGCALIHDYGNQGWDAYKAVDAFCAANVIELQVLDDYHHSALLRKSS